MRESGRVHVFEVLDEAAFIDAALALPGACHFAVVGCKPPDSWPAGLAEASETSDINRHEVYGRATPGFRIEAGSKAGIRDIVLGLYEPYCAHHWWIHSDVQMLVSCYDWPDSPNFAHLSLTAWLESLSLLAVVRMTGFDDFTDEWFDQQMEYCRE